MPEKQHDLDGGVSRSEQRNWIAPDDEWYARTVPAMKRNMISNIYLLPILAGSGKCKIRRHTVVSAGSLI